MDFCIRTDYNKSLVPANSVPAAAVRRKGLALSLYTRPKTWVGCSLFYISLLSLRLYYRKRELEYSPGQRNDSRTGRMGEYESEHQMRKHLP